MLNSSTIQGRLVRDPELKKKPNGVSVLAFTIACERNRAKEGEDRKSDFIDCVAWRSTAEFIDKYFSKGQDIIVSGELQTRSYEDKNGNKRKATEIVVGNVFFCGKKSDAPKERKPVDVDALEQYSKEHFGGDFAEIPEDEEDGDLPF